MAFSTYNGAITVSPFGQQSLAYVIRDDTDQIAVIDTQTVSNVDFAVYLCHPFTGDGQHRDLRKKVVRVNVFGEGEIDPAFGSAYMVIIADQSLTQTPRSDVYPYSSLSPWPPSNMLWRQNTLALEGRVFDVCLMLTGKGLKIREIELEYTIVG